MSRRGEEPSRNGNIAVGLAALLRSRTSLIQGLAAQLRLPLAATTGVAQGPGAVWWLGAAYVVGVMEQPVARQDLEGGTKVGYSDG